MKYRTRIYYTEDQKQQMWDHWQQGCSMTEIARLFDRYHTAVNRIIARSGGFRPRRRTRSRRSLSLAEREEISRGIAAGRSLRSIALRLGRSVSTISRELARNGGRRGYRAHRADQAAWDRALRPKVCKLASHPALARQVARRLQKLWAPQQIAGWLKRCYPDDESRWVSHETIYKTLFIQARGALKRELLAHLRRQRVIRYPRGTRAASRAGSSMRCRSESDHRKSRIVPCQATGKAT